MATNKKKSVPAGVEIYRNHTGFIKINRRSKAHESKLGLLSDHIALMMEHSFGSVVHSLVIWQCPTNRTSAQKDNLADI